VFYGDKVLLLRNEKGEWVLPKGVIRNGDLSNEVAVRRVREEAGVTAEIVSPAGNTSYEFFSVTRQKPVCNKITWYMMQNSDGKFQINSEENFTEGGFYGVNEAANLVTYSQDKSLLHLSFQRYQELSKEVC
jgi:8-oxo-dGTP pyrophosphatase MutT (NUDIX family)